jgi:hypothetical protein
MCIQDVHKFTKRFVRVVGRFHPESVWVGVPDKLCEVNDPTEHVTKAVEILDNFEQLIP